ncbi:MAG: hypothetical protein RLZZ65_1097 [Bacteroidota bacterium]|jgi:hypothetical protein
MRFYFLVLFAFYSGLLSAQTTDYKVYRKQQQRFPTCTVMDSAIVNDILKELLALDTTQFSSNLDDYYQDLAMSYYQVYCRRQDTSLLNNAIKTYIKIKVLTDSDYWNMMHIHCILGECQKGAYYLHLYRAATPLELQKPKEEEISRIQRICHISSQLQIELQYYEQNGIQKAAAMATHSPNSKYRAYKRRFDYIILNTPKIHAADQAEARKKLFDLYPDTLALKDEYKRLLVMDSTLSFHLIAMMEAIDQKGKGIEKTQYTEEEFFQVASRFFYIDEILSDTSFQTHVCIGFNGVNQTNDQKDLTLLAAFSYEAIFRDFDHAASVVEQVFEKHRKELEQKMMSGAIHKADIETLRNDLYTRMAQDLAFQKVLMDAYQQNKENLAFKLKPDNAYVFHFIPSVKDNIYGISLGPIGSEAICNAIKLRRTHGINIQLIGQGFFIPLNRKEFAFEQILLPLDSSFFTAQNTRSLHNGLLLSTFGTFTDFSNGIVLSAGCSFGRKVNGLAINLFASKYYVANGVELGIQNQAHKVNGLQVGLFNRCVELNGLQIGLWNVNEKRKLPLINW